jgi:topoisomerase IA-like protein
LQDLAADKHPEDGEDIAIRVSRYGAYLQEGIGSDLSKAFDGVEIQ